MSFEKAGQFVDLATLLRARRTGVTLTDIEERYGCSRRTAQRMMRSVEARFPDVEVDTDEEGRRRWRLRGPGLRDLLNLEPDEVASLDFALARLAGDGHTREAALLSRLREKVLALVPDARARSLAPDHDALLEAQGFVARPGPRPLTDEAVDAAVAEALKGCVVLEIDYQGRNDPAPRRRAVTPYGLLSGARRYLVARQEGDETGPVRTFRMDSIRAAALTGRGFVRPPEFDLHAFSRRAFGLFQSEQEYGDVVWRFGPRAAEQARGYLFHPDQTTEDLPDGSLLVRFRAAGHLEMAWHLYAWGDSVEVLEPPRLRDMVEGYRRSDFGALP